MEPLTFPIRLNRYLAHKGYSTRRGADELITKGLVKINGKAAKIRIYRGKFLSTRDAYDLG